jgi:glycosyltransferase involved in cell wall biosynthesis
MQPEVSIIIPAFNEGDAILPGLLKLHESVQAAHEILVVVDSSSDTTVDPVLSLSLIKPEIRLVVSEFQKGPANAIRFGFTISKGPVCVVTMSDGCDDPRQIDDLLRLVKRGAVVAAASRYMPGGQQVGGPRFKGMLSRTAGTMLFYFAGVGTRDATNSFKAYDKNFLEKVKPESVHGFELGIELTAKARRLRLPVAEIPTIWIDRAYGESSFKLWKWIPKYLRWFLFAFGPKIVEKRK